MYIIETNKLSKSYGKNRGICDVDLKIKEGEIFGFVGPNGAGKSTTIRTLLNFIFPTGGSAKIFGMDIVKDSKEIKKQIGYVPSEVKFYDESKVKDIVNYSASFYGGCSQEEINELYKLLDVDPEKKMCELSLGNKKKVAVIQAVIHKPKLLILDEPTNGLDPLIQKRMFELLEKARNNGTTIFFSSHNLVDVENVCDRVAVIKEGKIVDTIVIDKLLQKSGVKVVVQSDEIKDKDITDLGGKIISSESKDIIFTFEGNVDKLIKSLAKFKLKKLLITEQNLEDKFMNYYEKEDK